jgi:hypothetical protein
MAVSCRRTGSGKSNVKNYRSVTRLFAFGFTPVSTDSLNLCHGVFMGGFMPKKITIYTFGEIKKILSDVFEVDKENIGLPDFLDRLCAVGSSGIPIDKIDDDSYIIQIEA